MIRGFAVSGCDPEVMGIGPVRPSRKLLERAGLEIGDIDLMELNEAFASQSVAVIEELGIDPARVNVDGGAIALGHPLGATGARITGKAAQLLRRDGRPLRHLDAVHRRRPGHRDPARGGGVTALERVGVIGAGTMGAGIAAHAASAGLDVVLLDIVPDAARQAVERLAKARPPAFMQASDARRITPGGAGRRPRPAGRLRTG